MGLLKDWGNKLTGEDKRKKARKQQKKSDALMADQTKLGTEALDYAKGQDAQKLGYATDWYNEQRELLPQFMDNATAAFDETGENADDYYNEMVGNADQYSGQVLGDAQGYQSDILGNADEMLANADYTDAEYLDEEGRASADVTQAFSKARDASRRRALAYGVDPNSSAFLNSEAGGGLSQANAEAGAINSGRRGMRSQERDRTAAALGYKGNAITSGHGAVDSATRYGGGLKRDAFTQGRGAKDAATRYGRGMIADALNTKRNLIDPRLGLNGATLGQMNNNINTTGNQAAVWGNRAAASEAAGNAVLSDVLGLVGTGVGAMAGGGPGAAAGGMAGKAAGGVGSGGAGYTPPGGISQQDAFQQPAYQPSPWDNY